MIYTNQVGLAAVCVALIFVLWRRKKHSSPAEPGMLSKAPLIGRRFSGNGAAKRPGPRLLRVHGALVMIAAAELTLGVVPLQALLASWTSTPAKRWGLVALTLLLGGAVLWEVIFRRGFHAAMTTISCALFGVVGVTFWANLPRILQQGVKSIPSNGHALNAAMKTISSIKIAHHAGKHLPSISGLKVTDVLGIVAVLVIIFVVAEGNKIFRWAKRRGQAKNDRAGGKQRRRGPQAIPAGHGPRELTGN